MIKMKYQSYFHWFWDKIVWLFIFYLHCVHRGKSFEMSMINLWAEGLLTQHLSSMPSGDFVISTGQTLEKIRTDWFVIQFNLEEICKYIVHLRNEFNNISIDLCIEGKILQKISSMCRLFKWSNDIYPSKQQLNGSKVNYM